MDNSPYIQSQEKQRQAVSEWYRLLNNPFKAPEQKVGMPTDVFNAVVEVIAEYSLVKRGLG
jgi:hypothetical protein